jgi:hypothetical protein
MHDTLPQGTRRLWGEFPALWDAGFAADELFSDEDCDSHEIDKVFANLAE